MGLRISALRDPPSDIKRILPVTPFYSYHEPAILFNNFYDLLNFHSNRLKIDFLYFDF